MSLCLILVEDWPLAPDVSGGATSLIYSHLELLAHSGNEIALVVLSHPHDLKGSEDVKLEQPQEWDTLKKRCKAIYDIPLKPTPIKDSPLRRFGYLLFDPAAFRYGDLITGSGYDSLRKLINEIKPKFIWAEHLIPVTLAERSSANAPVIYSHHDWAWRIKGYRAGEEAKHWKKRLHFWVGKRHEETLVRRVSGCVSASMTETHQMRSLGAKHVEYFPTIYTPVDLPNGRTHNSRPRIVHLGGMQTTANRIGLQRFLEISWPVICEHVKSKPELWVIGSLEGAPEALLADLKGRGVICTGFVEDLSSVLRPFDIHIIPWEYNTGTRTRIPLILNYSQVLVSTRAGAACISELKHGENCVLADDLSQIAQQIIELFDDESAREEIGKAGRMTFLSHFTRESLQTRFNAFINSFGY
jgi:glycosyltransferase involved in cell wall biosynthesis